MPRRRKSDRTGAVIGTAMAIVGGAAIAAALLIPRRAHAAGMAAGEPVLSIDGLEVLRSGSILYWTNGDLSIDYDGAPNAYAPAGFGTPLDKLANAGHPGNWWGIATGADGQPLIQGPGEPYPGYYISTTSLAWPGQARTARYVDSTAISFLALPRVFTTLGARLGDLALVESPKTGRRRFAIWADVGPQGKLGEGSAKLVKELGVESSALRRSGINVSIFLGSGDGQPHAEEEIQRRGAELVRRFS
jgi:hypothetical protein